MLQVSATWVKDTDLFGRPRSPQLKMLDAAIEGYRRAPNWPNVLNMAKSLTVWEMASPTSARMRKQQVVALKQALTPIQKIILASPTFPWTSPTMQAMLTALEQPVGPLRTKALQTALDGISAADALTYRSALKAVIDANPQVCYVVVKTLTPSSVPSTSTDVRNTTATAPMDRDIRYDSAALKLQSQLYVIAPKSAAHVHEIGFLQHCTAKSDKAAYSDGSTMEDSCKLPFPVGDSTTDAFDHPWYYKGQSVHCTQPTWEALTEHSSQVDLEMNDSFIGNYHQFHPKAPPPGTYVLTSTLSSINRVQSFICYLVHKLPDGTYRLLRKVSYTINVALTANGQGAVTSYTTSVHPITPTTPLANEVLPAVSGPSMNKQSQWRYKAPNSANWANVTL